MIENFEFNNINSETFSIVCTSIKRPLIPSFHTRTIELRGQSGIYDFGGDEYESFDLTVSIAYIGDSLLEIRSKGREIASWLDTNQWGKLIIGDEPDKYYLARVSGKVNLETLKTIGQANITFICQPFAYMVAEIDADDTWDEADYPWVTPIPWNNEDNYTFATTTNKVFTFYNPGTKETNYRSPQGSRFKIKVTGSFTTLKISLNGKSINYNQAVSNGTVTIDNVEMEVKLNTTNKLNIVSGDLSTFLEVIPGNNNMVVTGTGLNIEVTIDFTPMWI